MLLWGKAEYERLLEKLTVIQATLDAISDSLADAGGGFRLDEANVQEGIANLMRFDGKLRKEGRT